MNIFTSLAVPLRYGRTAKKLGDYLTGRNCNSNDRSLASKIAVSALGGGDATNQVFLLKFRFGTNCEGVQQIQRKCVMKRFVPPIA